MSRGRATGWAEFAAKYGTPRKPLEERLADGDPCSWIDLEGARQVRRSMPDARLSSWPRPRG